MRALHPALIAVMLAAAGWVSPGQADSGRFTLVGNLERSKQVLDDGRFSLQADLTRQSVNAQAASGLRLIASLAKTGDPCHPDLIFTDGFEPGG